MNVKEMYEKVTVGQVLECLPGIEKLEADPDKGMRFRLKGISKEEDGDWAYFKVVGDFGEFEEFNKPLAKANYWDKNGKASETWMQQFYYHRDKNAVVIYVGGKDEVFKVVSNDVYDTYLKDNPDISYVEWLENVARGALAYEKKTDTIDKLMDSDAHK